MADGTLKDTGLAQWLTWQAILSGVTIVIAASYFLSSYVEGLINWAMYFVIIALGIGLIGKSYNDALFLQSQSQLATAQIKILEQVDNFADFLDQAEPSLFRTHIDNLFTISQMHSDISQDNLIELLHARLSARNKVVELFSSILITLGLIGTILGLMLMMAGLNTVLDGGAMDAGMMDQLLGDSGPLSGLDVAFVTTLLGAVFGGVILRVLTSVVESSITDYTAHVAELTEVFVLPFLRKTAREREGAATA